MKIKNFISLLMIVSISCAVSSCNCDDIISEEKQWNHIEVSPSLVGQVSTIGNVPLANAIVAVSIDGKDFNCTTDADGRYVINDLESGICKVTASYPSDPNFVSSTSTVLLENGATAVWNTVLYAASTNAIVEETDDGAIYSIELPDLVNTEVSSGQTATFDVPSGAIEQDDKLILSTYYDIKKGSSTRSDYSYSGSDVVVVCDSKTELGVSSAQKPITIAAYGMSRPSAVYHNGKLVKDLEYSENDEYCYFHTTELGITEFCYPISISETKVEAQQLKFEKSEFEGKIDHITAKYFYKNGVDITLSNTYLDQYALLLQGNLVAKDCEGIVDMNIAIPAGERVVVSAEQAVSTFSYKCGEVIVPVVRYGKVYTKVSDRQHTGGSSK